MKSEDLAHVRRTLWKAADELRANSTLTPADYREPVLGLSFLDYAEHRFESVRPELEAQCHNRSPPMSQNNTRGCVAARVQGRHRLLAMMGAADATAPPAGEGDNRT